MRQQVPAPCVERRNAPARCSSRLWRLCVFVHEVGGRLLYLRSVTEQPERLAAMAGVFDIDLDQPEENVSDDENDEVLYRRLSELKLRAARWLAALAWWAASSHSRPAGCCSRSCQGLTHTPFATISTATHTTEQAPFVFPHFYKALQGWDLCVAEAVTVAVIQGGLCKPSLLGQRCSSDKCGSVCNSLFWQI